MSTSDARVSLDLKIESLRNATCYSHACAPIKVIETHFAYVFLTGEFAYKLKKPVQVERMDFRTLDARERSCREEVRLNRRMAAKVYLGAVPLSATNGTLRVDGEGSVVDWLVKMRQLPEEHLLNHAITAKTADRIRLSSAATVLARFFQSQDPTGITPDEYLIRLFDRCAQCRAELLANDLGIEISPVEEAYRQQLDFLHRARPLIYERAARGRIIEGHGDLRPDHIFLGCGTQNMEACVIDCLEFDRDLRILDPYEELAFLFLECERLGATSAAQVFIDTYADTGDRCARELFRFYRAARAINRAKIAAWHLRDASVSHMADWRAIAHDYIRTALDSSY